MLRELHIANLAVIAEAHIELSAGLNCFTGATGAGKSLVIGAINILLGLKSAADLLRRGAQEGHVTGVFEIADGATLDRVRRLVDLPLDGEEARAGELLLTRRLFASGRTRVSLNGNPITLAQLKDLGELLVDVHGQHDTAYLLKPANQLDVLDQFAGLEDQRAAYHATWSQLQQARRTLADLSNGRELREQTLELYRFQAEEIDRAELDPAEFEALKQRASMLENLERLKTDSAEAYAGLYEADGAVVDRLKRIARTLDELAELDGQVAPVAEAVRGGMIQLEEAARDLDRYMNKLDLDPAELAEVNERLTGIHKVLHKYGGTIDAAMAYREHIGGKIKVLSGQTEDLAGLQAKIAPLEKRLMEQGRTLSGQRTAAAKKLGPVIEAQLAELGMERARFRVEVTPLASGRATGGLSASASGDQRPDTGGQAASGTTGTESAAAVDAATPSGFDQVEFVAQTNPGLDAQPLRRIASGGELSRIMLALKQVLKRDDRVSVLVFDEIDANVGGRLAAVVGHKLRELAGCNQVLCITHLPQIASYADRHLTVRKEQRGDQTRTTVELVEGDARLEELAEMIGGKTISATTRAQARELLDIAAAEFGRTKRRRRAS